MENQAPTAPNALPTCPSPGEKIPVGDEKLKEGLNTVSPMGTACCVCGAGTGKPWGILSHFLLIM